MESKRIFIICSVRDATPEIRLALERHTDTLEGEGHEVHLPHRDTNQAAAGFNICLENAAAINFADEVHIFFNEKSYGSHFDMGVAFALQVIIGMKKEIVIITGAEETEGKSFKMMLLEWEKFQRGEFVE